MVTRILSILVLLQSAPFLLLSSCDRRNRSMLMDAPIYHISTSDILPSDVQITTMLSKDTPKRLVYTSVVSEGSLSATVSPCAAPVRWWVEGPNATRSPQWVTSAMDTRPITTTTTPQSYYLHLVAVEEDTLVHIYISTEPGGPQALQTLRGRNVRLLRRQRRRLTVKWNPSLVDPQCTDYCLVVSKLRPYASLCSAHLANQRIACVGRNTHYTLSDMQQGQKYYFNLFATNNESNFTYLFGSQNLIYDSHFKTSPLKDGKATFANLKHLDGKAVFRYKVGRKADKSLDLYVMPCGGAVDVEVSLKDTTVAPPRRIEGFGKISVPKPISGARYYIKIFASNREELKKTTGVEIYASTRSSNRIPLPSMPNQLKLQEYSSLKGCRSVTVAWLAAPVARTVRYCLTVKEGKIREMEDYTMPNQCGLDNRLKKSADFAVKKCLDAKYTKEEVVLQKVDRLKPGRHYIVQVTVKKPKGKTLSYDLLQVYTKNCNGNKSMVP